MKNKWYILRALILSLLVFFSLNSLTSLYASDSGLQAFTLSASSIPEEEKIPLDNATIKYGSLIYTGMERTQTIPTVVTAIVDGETVELKKNRDFKVKYENNLNAGLATMIISGTGKYTGSIVKHFKIRPVKLKSAELGFKEAEYTGEPITQDDATVVRARVDCQMRVLNNVTDYSITYINNIDVGTATMVIKGNGNFTGTITETFEIISN